MDQEDELELGKEPFPYVIVNGDPVIMSNFD